MIPTTVAVNAVAGTMSSAGGTAHKHGFGWGQQDWENGYCQPVVSVHGTQDPDTNTELAHPLGRNHGQENAVFHTTGAGWWNQDEVSGTLRAREQESHEHLVGGMAVRRLTPVECERLQGFPDGWTAIPYRNKPAADGHRYKALGNSMAVPVITWLGKRIMKSPH